MVFLTFDDGLSKWTKEFLDVLKQDGSKATFSYY
ncbi:polysaccharide deacetylase family protein [Brevibacillus reuszeri]